MWLAGPDPMDVFVGLTRGAVSLVGQPPSWLTYAGAEAGIEVLFDAAASHPWPRWRGRRPVRIWLSGALARPFMLGPINGLKGWQEVNAFAESAALDAVGLEVPCVVQVESWPEPHAALSVAVSRALAEQVSAKAKERRLRLVSVRPWWAAVANEASAMNKVARLVSISDHDSMTLLGGQQDRFDTASSYLPRTSADQAEKLLARMALVVGAKSEEALRFSLADATEAATLNVPFGATEGST